VLFLRNYDDSLKSVYPQGSTNMAILCLHDLPSLPLKLCFFARSGPPFVIRSVLIGWGCPGLQIVDLSERENGFWGRERGDRANTELPDAIAKR